MTNVRRGSYESLPPSSRPEFEGSYDVTRPDFEGNGCPAPATAASRVAAAWQHEGSGERALDICHHSPLRHLSPIAPSLLPCLTMPARGLQDRRRGLQFSTTTTFARPMDCISQTLVRLLAPSLPPSVLTCSMARRRPGFCLERLNNDDWRQLDDARSVHAAACDVDSPI